MKRDRPRPWVAIGITVVICGLAIQDQITNRDVSDNLVWALLVLAAFWIGQGADRLLDRFFPPPK